MILKRIVLFSRGAFYRNFFSQRPEGDAEKDSPFQQGAFLQNFFSRRPEGDAEKDSPFQQGAFYRFFSLGGREVILKRTILFSTPFLDRIVFFSSPGRCPE